MPVGSLKLTVLAVLTAAGMLGLQSAAAQTAPQKSDVHPITSLPKAPGDPSAVVPPPAPPPAVPPPASAPSQPVPAIANPEPASSAPVYAPAPAPVYAPEPSLQASTAAPVPAAPRLQRNRIRPFSTAAIGVNLGIGGVGLQIAVPLSQTTNLRGGGDFINYSKDFTENGLRFAGDLKFRSGNVNLDWFPFHGAFRISPGVTLYNGNAINASVTTTGGQQFELAEATYTSSTTDPVHGTASVAFGNRVVPQLTFGFGNMIPRGGGHFSVPFEIGL